MKKPEHFIEKKELIDGRWYIGQCRNSSLALWDSKLNCFFYIRDKLGGKLLEKINHPEDDDGFDLFYPLKRLEI